MNESIQIFGEKEHAFEIKEIRREDELKKVLAMCERILGHRCDDLYSYEAWLHRMNEGVSPMIYAEAGNEVISAVLGRAENCDSLVIGYVACDERFRRKGITQKLMNCFETSAKKRGYKYISLGSYADEFYEKCGYRKIGQANGQSIYQKVII